MSRGLLTVEPGLPLTEVAKRMVARDVGAVLVLDGERLVGGSQRGRVHRGQDGAADLVVIGLDRRGVGLVDADASEPVVTKITSPMVMEYTGDKPEDYAADVKWMMEQPQNFFMVKQGISFHSNMKDTIPDFHYGVKLQKAGYHGMMEQGPISERGMAHMIECVIAMKEVLGDRVSLALDCGPGWMLPDAIRFARALKNAISASTYGRSVWTSTRSTLSRRNASSRPDAAARARRA